MTNYRHIALFIVVNLLVVPIIQQSLFANHGEEITIKFNDAQFFLPIDKSAQQVKLTTTYTVSDSDTVGKQINGIMQVYTQNETLIKTTSIPNGFKAEESGFQQFVTSLPNTTFQSITTIVLFTDLNKTSPLSNSITKNLVLNKSQ